MAVMPPFKKINKIDRNSFIELLEVLEEMLNNSKDLSPEDIWGAFSQVLSLLNIEEIDFWDIPREAYAALWMEKPIHNFIEKLRNYVREDCSFKDQRAILKMR